VSQTVLHDNQFISINTASHLDVKQDNVSCWGSYLPIKHTSFSSFFNL